MGKKQNPTWQQLFDQQADGHKQAIEFHSSIIADAEAILLRPPRLCDFNQDFIELLVRRWVRAHTSYQQKKTQARVQRLKQVVDAARQRFNIPAIDFEKLPTCDRDIKAELLTLATPVPEVHPEDLPAGLNPAIVNQKLSTVLAQYERERLLGKSVETKRLMRVAVRKYSEWLCRDALLSDLNRERVLSYMEYLIQGGTLARASMRTLQERLQALWRFACAKHWLIEGPNLPLISCPERDPDSWSNADMVAMLQAAKSLDGNMKPGSVMENVPWSLFWTVLIMFLYDSAERIGAVTSVKFDDINGEWVTFRAEYRKGHTRDRRIKLRQCTLDGVTELRRLTQEKRVKRIFEFPYTATYLWTKFNKVLETAGLPTDRRSKFHKVRRSCASEFEAHGGNATKLLDHTHRGTTKKYLDPKVVKETQLVDLVPGIGEAPKPKQDAAILAQLRTLLAGSN